MGRARKTQVLLVAVSVAVSAIALVGSASGAVTKEVKLNGIEFDPSLTKARVGDSVHWSRGTGSLPHNVHQSQDIFRSGGITSGPIDFTRKFSAGTFPYVCDQHGSSGMRGTVKIPVKVIAGEEGGVPTVRWATANTNTGGRFDVQFKVEDGAWQNWRSNTEATLGFFGDGDEPVQVESGTIYRFRARSQKSGNESKWSPAKRYVHP